MVKELSFQLTSLHLRCKMSSTSFAALALLHRLHTLRVYVSNDCVLTQHDLQAMSNLTALQELDLKFARAPRAGQLAYTSLSSFQYLQVTCIDFHATPKCLTDLGLLPKLQVLTLSGCDNYDCLRIPASLTALCALRSLRLLQLKLSGFPQNIASIPQLTALTLSGVGLSNSDSMTFLPEIVGNMTQLQHLSVGHSAFDVEACTLDRLLHLTQLELDNLHLGANGGSFVMPSSLTNLAVLSLVQNDLARMPRGLTKLSRLRDIDLTYQRRQDLPPAAADASDLLLSCQPVRCTGLQLDESLIEIACMPLLEELGLTQGDGHKWSAESLYYCTAAQAAMRAAGRQCDFRFQY